MRIKVLTRSSEGPRFMSIRAAAAEAAKIKRSIVDPTIPKTTSEPVVKPSGTRPYTVEEWQAYYAKRKLEAQGVTTERN
jgi:hypothetical protein